MANSLVDFVLSLVRDPEVAARYSADPDAAIAAAHLIGVTSADVDNLIPMVADSLAASTPGFGGGTSHTDGGNVWTTGAATAAFDAFGVVEPQAPSVIRDPAINPLQIHDTISDHTPLLESVVESAASHGVTGQAGIDRIEIALDDVPHWSESGGWEHVHDPHPGVDHPGFDTNP